ncbi:MAG: hypothetical protein HYY84_16630 [Deltaproteobacteria bacterium]|nr:hypothetical protein [Deltaproteobacteria bacterium]
MRRFIAFLVLATSGWFIYQTSCAEDLAGWRIRLERERGVVAEESAHVLSTINGANEAVRYFRKLANSTDKRVRAAKADRDDAGTKRGYLIALAVFAFIAWVWPKSRRVVTATTTTTARAGPTDTPATHRTAVGGVVSQTVPLGAGERVEFLTDGKGQRADLASTSCQVCGEALESDVVTCERCQTPHHEECWTWNKGCSTFGCGERSFNRSEG